MSHSIPLPNAVSIVAGLRERLKAEFDLDDGDETLEDTLEGATDLNEQLAKIARQAIETEAFAGALGEIIKTSQSRKARLEYRAERLRAVIKWAMSESGTQKASLPDITLSLSKGRPPVIIDYIFPLPDRFARVKREPDTVAIRVALESGELLDFARLGNAQPTLTIRVR